MKGILIGGAIAVAGTLVLINLFKPSGFTKGDVLDFYVDGHWGNYITILGVEGNQYLVIEGYYPDVVGSSYYLAKSDVDGSSLVRKIDTVPI